MPETPEITGEETSVDKSEEIISDTEEQEREKEETKDIELKLHKCVYNCSSEDTIECKKCHRLYCVLHASRFSPQFCQDCFKALSLIIDKFERRVEDYDVLNDAVTTRKESCKRLRLDGPDWVFYTAWIYKLTDEELQSVFEFHYFVVKLIETENEQRKIRTTTKLRGMPVPMSVSTTKETRTRKESKPRDPLKELRKMFPGLADDKLQEMLKVMGGGN